MDNDRSLDKSMNVTSYHICNIHTFVYDISTEIFVLFCKWKLIPKLRPVVPMALSFNR